MKFIIGSLKIGDIVDGRIAEILDQSEVIISFQGDLLRVQNESRRPFKVGEIVSLVVAGTAPLLFQLKENRRATSRFGHLDIEV